MGIRLVAGALPRASWIALSMIYRGNQSDLEVQERAAMRAMAMQHVMGSFTKLMVGAG